MWRTFVLLEGLRAALGAERAALLSIAAVILVLLLIFLPSNTTWESATSLALQMDAEPIYEPTFEDDELALLLIILGALVFVPRDQTGPARRLPLCARRLAGSGLHFMNIRLLDGCLRSVRWSACVPKLRRSARRLRLWPVVAAARARDRAVNRTAFYAATASGWARGLAEWCRRNGHSNWRKLTTGAKLYYLCFAALVCSIPSPEEVTVVTTLTPSQIATDPFMSPAAHAAHLVVHGEHRLHDWLMSLGPVGFDALLASPPPAQCNVTIDFTLLDPDATELSMDDVPANETVQSVAAAVAAVLGIPCTEVGVVHRNQQCPNPTTRLSSLAVEGRVELLVFPNELVGGDGGNGGDDDACSTCLEPPPYPPHPGRRIAEEQPDPVERPSRPPHQRWYCKALAEQERSGKATGWNQKRPEFVGRSREDVLQQREAWLQAFTHPKPKAAPTGKRFAPTIVERERHPKRVATPDKFAEPGLPCGPTKGKARAGPGRGKTFEPAAEAKGSSSTLEEPIAILAAKSTNWLAQASQRSQWQTSRITQLEEQLAVALLGNAQRDLIIERQAQTIVQLRERVRQLEADELMLAQQLLSHAETDTPLKQASHAGALLEDPKWRAVLGVGYRSDQKRSLVYQHVAKLMAHTHEITQGDPLKAKYLADMLCATLLHACAHHCPLHPYVTQLTLRIVDPYSVLQTLPAGTNVSTLASSESLILWRRHRHATMPSTRASPCRSVNSCTNCTIVVVRADGLTSFDRRNRWSPLQSRRLQ